MKSFITTIIAFVIAQAAFACSASFYNYFAPSGNNLFRMGYYTGSASGTLPAGHHMQNTIYFGDGTSATISGNFNPAYHNYSAAGTYSVKLITTIIDSAGSSVTCIDSVVHPLTITSMPCGTIWSTVTGAGGSATFTASNPGGASGLVYTWYFGDGTTGTGNPVTHVYSTNGSFSVTCYDTSATNICSYSNVGSIAITTQSVCAGVHASFTPYYSGNIVYFTNTSVGPVATVVTQYHWTFGDGSSVNSYSPSHTYAAAGIYTVGYRVTWLDSITSSVVCTDSTTQTITISNPCAGHASFTSLVSGNLASFTNTSTTVSSGTSIYANAWSFGDGFNTSVSSPYHSYAPGTYNVRLVVTFHDSLNSSNCMDTVTHAVTVYLCSGHAAFTSSVSGSTASFTNTSSTISIGTSVAGSIWSLGDGTYNYTLSPSHFYSAAGTYNVQLVMTFHDSLNSSYCSDTVVHAVVIGTGGTVNKITGDLFTDSLVSNPLSPTFKVWLIKHDSATNSLSAVDSVNVIGAYYHGSYTFSNEPAGSYRVKAALTNGPTSGTASVPTYGYDSLYWHGAHVINYSGSGINSGNNIMMRNGIVTSGPGFIGGSVLAGANKGTQTTGIPVANLTILLENMNGTPISYTVTDANGAYQFSNFPTGSYQVYPEGLGYMTTPAPVTVGSAQTHVDFTQHTISKTITPSTTGIVNVTANTPTFNVFPNPGSGLFNISWASNTALKAVHAIVSDVVGHKVFETDLNMTTPTGFTQINIANLQSGVYFISLKADGMNYMSKVVLQH
jgi:PKD repeat protein